MHLLKAGLPDFRAVLVRPLPRDDKRHSACIFLKHGINAKGSVEVPAQQLVQSLALGREAVFRHRKLKAAFRQARINLQFVSPEHRLLQSVTGGDSLRFFQGCNGLPCRFYPGLCGHELEISIPHFGCDFLALSTNIFTSDLASQLGCADSEADLVLLGEWLVCVASNVGREACRIANLRSSPWYWPYARISTERTLVKREIKRVHQLATERCKLKLGQPPAVRRAHPEVKLLCLQSGVLHKPVIAEGERYRVFQCQKWCVRFRRRYRLPLRVYCARGYNGKHQQ